MFDASVEEREGAGSLLSERQQSQQGNRGRSVFRMGTRRLRSGTAPVCEEKIHSFVGGPAVGFEARFISPGAEAAEDNINHLLPSQDSTRHGAQLKKCFRRPSAGLLSYAPVISIIRRNVAGSRQNSAQHPIPQGPSPVTSSFCPLPPFSISTLATRNRVIVTEGIQLFRHTLHLLLVPLLKHQHSLVKRPPTALGSELL